MIVLEIEASKPPRTNLKSGQRYRNDMSVHTYTALGLFVLSSLRPKNKVKLSTQSAENWICMRKWAFEVLVILFLRIQKGPDVQIFQGLRLLSTNAAPKKNRPESSLRDKEKILSQKNSIFAKIFIIRPGTPSFWPMQTSIAPPILAHWWQTMARWSCGTKRSSFLAT